MVSSKYVIDYVKKNLNKNYYVSFFVSGSMPQELAPEKDVDLFIVINKDSKKKFFDNLSRIMDQFVSKNKSVKYSFIRGPIKYETKGLISFLIFTSGDLGNEKDKESFTNEHIPILKSHIKHAKLVSGKSLTYLLKDMNWKRKDTSGTGWIVKKKKLLIDKNLVRYRIWKKTKKGWGLVRITLKPSKFLRQYLLDYFKKHIGK